MNSAALSNAVARTYRHPAFLPSNVCLTAAILTFLMYLSLATFPASFRSLNREDGAVEWATVACLLLAALMALCSTVGHRAKFNRLAIALVFFVMAGEEISWGQRLFGVATPDGLAAINVQAELNFHNISGIHQNIRAVGILGLGFAFVIAPMIAQRSRHFDALVRKLNLPFLNVQGLAIFVLAVLLMVVPRALDVSTKFDEGGELLMSLAFVVYGCLMIQFEAPAKAAAS